MKNAPSPRPTPPDGGEGVQNGRVFPSRPVVRSSVDVATIAPELRTVRQQEQVREADRLRFGVMQEVQEQARALGVKAESMAALVRRAAGRFRIVDGRVCPVSDDGRRVLLSADGVAELSVGEWLRRQASVSPEWFDGAAVAAASLAQLPMRNPFRKETFNLTEQMKLIRRDPERARRLRAEAMAEGE